MKVDENSDPREVGVAEVVGRPDDERSAAVGAGGAPGESGDEGSAAEWADPGFFSRQSRLRNILRVLKNLIIPVEGHNIVPTPAGLVLILLALGIGSAAYNTSSNILFMTLSLLLSSLLLSGILSWMNFKGTRWRLVLEPHFRAGEATPVRVDLSNDKRLLPTYSIWFNLRAVVGEVGKRLYLRERLDAGSTTGLTWLHEPDRRGVETIEISGLETQFPFGFLRKVIGGGISREVRVWPARVDYEFAVRSGHHAHRHGETVLRPGEGSEILNLRDYAAGDPQRLVHWKASARLRRLVVRQTIEDNQDAYLIFVETPGAVWRDPDQFEVLCSFAASLAEDLYMDNRLWGVAVNDSPVRPVKRLTDLHHFLGQLAELDPVDHYTPASQVFSATVITFSPGSGKEVNAHVGGVTAGSA